MGGSNEASSNDLSLPITGVGLLPGRTEATHDSPANARKRSRSEEPLESSNRPSKQRAGTQLSEVEVESIVSSETDPTHGHDVATPAAPSVSVLDTRRSNQADEENDKVGDPSDSIGAVLLNVSSEEKERQESIAAERQELLDHIAPKIQRYRNPSYGDRWRVFSMDKYVEFFFQCGTQDARCRLRSCTYKDQRIWRDQYRIAVKPGSHHWAGSPEYYHVRCFEELSDLQSLDFLARFNHRSSGFYADPGAITIYCIWRQELIKQAQEAMVHEATIQDRESNQERETGAEANTGPMSVEGNGEFFNVLVSEIETKQVHGQAVNAADIAAMMARYRTDQFLQLIDKQDFTIKPVQVLDKDLPNGEHTWKFIDGDSDWQITDYIVEREVGEEDAKSTEVEEDKPREPEHTDIENDANAPENMPNSRCRLSRALRSWEFDAFLALKDDSHLDAQLLEMKKAREFTAGDVFRIQQQMEPWKHRINERRRSEVESTDEINRQIREMERNVPAD